MHSLRLPHGFSDGVEDLREGELVVLDEIVALKGVLPMLPDVLGISGQLIVIEFVVDVVRSLARIDESHEIRDVNLLCKVLDVQTDVNNLSFVLTIFIVGNKERSCQLVDDTRFELEHLLDLKVSKPSLSPGPTALLALLSYAGCLILRDTMLLELSPEQILMKEGIVDLPLLCLLVDLELDHASPHISSLDSTHDSQEP